MTGSADRAARHFAEAVVDAVFAAWADDLVRRVGLSAGERVLDVGCGTGAVARAAAPLVGPRGRVVGIDTSVERITMARGLPAVDGAAIEWRQADATDMPFADASFDAALCQQVLHLVPKQGAVLSETRRVLVPGGRLGLSVWQSMEHSPAYLPIAEAVARHLGSEEGARFGRSFSLADEGEVRRLLGEAGFVDVEIVQETKIADFATPEDFIAYQMDVNVERWHLSPDVRATLVAEIREGLEPFVEGGRLRFPRGAHIALARR